MTVSLNRAMTKNDALDRQLGAEREKFKQHKTNAESLQDRMRVELDTVEHRFDAVVHRNTMIGEDFRSQAHNNLMKFFDMRKQFKKKTAECEELQRLLHEQIIISRNFEQEMEEGNMLAEDYYGRLQLIHPRIQRQMDLIAELSKKESQFDQILEKEIAQAKEAEE